MSDFTVFVSGCSTRTISLLIELKQIIVGAETEFADLAKLADYAKFVESTKNKRLVVVGIYDCVRESIEPFKKKLTEHAIDFIDYTPDLTADAIQKCKPNITIVGSVNSRHADEIIAALEAGSIVFCEKPLCTTIDDAMRIQQAALIARKPIFSGFVLRHAPVWVKVKELLTDSIPELTTSYGRVDSEQLFTTGRVLNIVLNETLWKGHGVLARDGWRGHKSESGGHWVEKLCHPIDLCDWFMDDIPLECTAMNSTAYWKAGTEELDVRAICSQDNTNLMKAYNTDDVRRNISRDPTYDVEDSFAGSVRYGCDRMVSIISNTYSVSGGRLMSIECENHCTIHVEAPNHKTQKIIVEYRGFERNKPHEMSNRMVYELPAAGCHGNGDSFIMKELFAHTVDHNFDDVDEVELLNDYAEQTLEFIKSTVIAICLEKAASTKTYVDFTPIWKDFGLNRRIENYGYNHKDKESSQTKWLDCVSEIIYSPADRGYGYTWPQCDDSLPCTAAFVIPYDGEYYYLMQHETRGIDIAGGRMEKDETPVKCAIRELKEETGIVCNSKLEHCGTKFMLALHKLDPRFKYPAKTQNRFYVARIPKMTDDEFANLKPAVGDASKRCVRFTYDQAVRLQCVRIHMWFFNLIEGMWLH